MIRKDLRVIKVLKDKWYEVAKHLQVRDSRFSLLMIIQKPKNMQSTRLSVMSLTDPSEGKVTGTSASQRDRSL